MRGMKASGSFEAARESWFNGLQEVVHLFGCQPVLLHPEPDLQAILEYLCSESNKLFNCAAYYARQVYFKTRKSVGKARLDEEMKSNLHFQAMHSQAAQQTCHSVWEAFKSYRELLAMWRRGELADKPKLPNYRDAGFYVASYPKQALKLVDGMIRVPLGNKVKIWFGIDSFTLPMPSNLKFGDIKEIRILPRHRCFYAEFVYQQSIHQADIDPSRVLGIDPGVNNWLTCVSNIGKSFLVDGKQVKAWNQWYNKRVATLKEGQPQGFWSPELASITEKRNRQMRDSVNKAARFVLNWCLENRIGTVVFGWNDGIKDSVNLGRKNNQEFVQISTARLRDRLAQLFEQHGIEFIQQEESYTSQASFLDGDFVPTFGEKPETWQASGKRLARGLYRTARGWLVNADAQAVGNLLVKVNIQLSRNFDLARVSRAVLTLPQRYGLDSLSKAYRKQCEEARLQPAS